MGNENDIETLIASTITHIKAALDSNKPGEVKLYAAALVLLRQAQSISSVNWLLKKDKTLDKPFEKISEKHIPDV